jgi:CheY-like chemotaxis protein
MSIVREHGGNIEAESLPAGGSAFTIFLPVASGRQSEALPAPLPSVVASSEALRATADLLRGRAVLVLDDEQSLRMLLQEGLSAQGLRVDCAATTEEAFALVARFGYDVFLCDLHLSSGGLAVDGREAANRILNAAPAQKPAVIYMTGDLTESHQFTAARGEPLCLQKPFRISDVLAILRDVLLNAPAETPPAR